MKLCFINIIETFYSENISTTAIKIIIDNGEMRVELSETE